MSNTICRAWLPYLDEDIPADIKAPADVAAFELVLGCARLAIGTGEHPSALKDMVCSPGGTTIEAVAKLEECGLRNAVIQAARAAMEKAEKMAGAGSKK